MKYYIIIFFLVGTFVLRSQNPKTYRFIDYNLYSLQNTKNNAFSYQRTWLRDSTYKVEGLFSFFDTLKTTFYLKNNVWKVKKGCTWKLFFNSGLPVTTLFSNGKHKYKIVWEKTSLLDNGDTVYKLEFKPIGFSFSGNPTYYFTYKEGVIAINGHDMLLIREDKTYLKLPLGR
jgi:hypothetical protein